MSKGNGRNPRIVEEIYDKAWRLDDAQRRHAVFGNGGCKPRTSEEWRSDENLCLLEVLEDGGVEYFKAFISLQPSRAYEVFVSWGSDDGLSIMSRILGVPRRGLESYVESLNSNGSNSPSNNGSSEVDVRLAHLNTVASRARSLASAQTSDGFFSWDYNFYQVLRGNRESFLACSEVIPETVFRVLNRSYADKGLLGEFLELHPIYCTQSVRAPPKMRKSKKKYDVDD
ncbi:hypothetical protein COU61_02260 [Candidatus Pacearchaeota archaeon CG10_big_fil_rev_8_21_14_0_10_35_13]|nr:MAG: hypothetical protein COU61_02260 [Candidatus Pacearchaeota archaeon CG10_big_fil_rev_8_21_14_0_10_35_13]